MMYTERFRPQYHFSMRKGWINDPNGLVHYGGVYHLFCQHHPDDVRWGPMHWSHAVSPDLVNWKEQPIALYPDTLGTCFSGSAVVDWQNTSGLDETGRPALLAFYTAAGGCVTPHVPFTQCVAFSNDNGQTWLKYEGNPVLQNVAEANRDPKVFWYGPTKRWIMVLYLEGSTFGIFGSADTRNWEELSRFDVDGNCECPDLFEMPVAGHDGLRKWIFLSGSGKWDQGDCARYVVGSFDGATFSPESDAISIEWGGWNYSTQTWSDAPDGRRVFIGWFSTSFDGSGVLPGNPFAGQYRVPWNLTLMQTSDGLRLAKLPVEELQMLREAPVRLAADDLSDGVHAVNGLRTRSFDIECAICTGNANAIAFQSEGVEILRYEVRSQTMRVLGREHHWPLEPGNILSARILFDVNCVEVFGPLGLNVMSGIYTPHTLKSMDETKPLLSIAIEGGAVSVPHMAIYPMRSIWHRP